MFSAKSRSSGFFQAAGLSVVAGVFSSFHVLAATGVPTTAAPLVQPSYFESEDIFGLEWASDPQLSPDGRTIVYVRNSNDIMTDRARTALWQIDVASGQHTPLYADKFNYSQPRWAPDGSRLAFISDQSGKAQIHLHWVKTAQTTQLSRLDKSPSNLTWSPDSKQLAFTMNLPATPSALTTLVKMPKKPKDANWSEPVVVIDRAQYQADGQGFLKSEYRHLFLLSSDGGSARQLTSGDRSYGEDLTFSPDGKALVFSANLAPDWEYQPRDSDLYQLDLRSGQLKQLTAVPGQETSPVFSPDGKKLAYLWGSNAKLPFANGKLKVLDVASGKSRDIGASLDLDLNAPDWWSNDELTVQYDEKGLRKVALLDLGGELTVLTDQLSGTGLPQPYLSGEYQQSAEKLVFTKGDESRPADVALWQDGKVRQLTQLNEDLLGHKTLGQVHEITYKSSFDGELIQGWYILPPDFDPKKKYPMMLEIHGGPHLAYGPHFSAEMQRFAREGYVVFYDNHRGSTGYGERFALLLHNKYSSPEDYADHDSGVNAMIAKGFVDADNVYIAGGSAGGIATAYAIGLTDRYRAAAVIKPIINWVSKVLTGDSYLYQTYHQFPGVPWEHLDHYWQRSPIANAGKIKTPTLIMTGEADRRTPISESEQLYQALKLQHVPTALVRVPGAPHGIAGRPSRMIAKIEHTLAWFELHKKQ